MFEHLHSLYMRYQHLIEAPLAYGAGLVANCVWFVGSVDEEPPIPFGWGPYLAVGLAPVWLLLWYNIRGKELVVRAQMTKQAAGWLKLKQSEALSIYYQFLVSGEVIRHEDLMDSKNQERWRAFLRKKEEARWC